MGSNSSKTSGEQTFPVQKNDDEIGASSDPRSPTPEIIRTPLNAKSGTKHNITKNVDLRKTFECVNNEEDKVINNNPILSAVIKNHLQSYDPRSPTQEFERTPIVLSKADEITDDKRILRLQNITEFGSPSLNNDSCISEMDGADAIISECIVPKNLCNGFLDLTLDETKSSEVPLGSSTASNGSIEKNISHEGDNPIKYLETNFDYIDTNAGDKLKGGDLANCPETVDSKIDRIQQFKILDIDPRSPSIGIERTPIVVAKLEEQSTENAEEMSDDTLIKVLQKTNAGLKQGISCPSKSNCEELLIYEDESEPLNDTPRKSKSINNEARTPLSCMKNKTDHIRSKSVNTILDGKSPKAAQIVSKIPRRISHIPRLKTVNKQTSCILNVRGSATSLKSLTKTTAISGDCENTPPHSHRDLWDKDNSIVL